MRKTLSAILIILLLSSLLCGCAQKHYNEDNISELYDREWIIGKSRSQIVDKYGPFDRAFISNAGENLGAYYVNEDNNVFDPSHIHDTYFIVFDDADVAIDAYFAQTSIGG